MGQHYTKNTVAVSHWCNNCSMMTMWRVLSGKLAFCIPCHEKPSVMKPAKINNLALQESLF